MKKVNLKKLTVTALMAAIAVVGVCFPFRSLDPKCTDPASGQHFMRCYRRSMVGIGTGFYRVAHS